MPAATVAALPPLLPPGHALDVPGVADRTERGVLRRRAHGELVAVGLADAHRAGVEESLHGGARVRRLESLEDLRRRGRLDTVDAEHVLERHRNAAQRRCGVRVLREHLRGGIGLLRSARSCVTLRYALRLLSLRSRCASVSSSNARGVVEPSRSAAASSVIVPAVELTGRLAVAHLNRSDDEVTAVGCRSVAQRGNGAERRLGHVGAHHVDEVADLRRLGEHRCVDLLEARDVIEDFLELAEEAALLLIAEAEPGKHCDVIDVVSGKCHGAAIIPASRLSRAGAR